MGRAPGGRGPRGAFRRRRGAQADLPAEKPGRGAPEGDRGASFRDRRAARAAGFLRAEPGRRSRPADRIAEAGRGKAARADRGALEPDRDPRAAAEGPLRRPRQPPEKARADAIAASGQAEPGRAQRRRRKTGVRAGAQPVQARQLSALHHQLPEFHDQFREQRAPAVGAVLDRQRVLRDARLQVSHRRPAKSGQALAGEFQGAGCAAQHRELPGGAGTEPRRARDAARPRQEISLQPGGRAGEAAPRDEKQVAPATAVSLRSAVTASNPATLASAVVWGAFALAFLFGAVGNKTHFCTMGAVSDVVNMGDWNRMRMWLLAIAVATVGAGALQLAGLVDLSKTIYTAPRFTWLSYVLGGLLFG